MGVSFARTKDGVAGRSGYIAMRGSDRIVKI